MASNALGTGRTQEDAMTHHLASLSQTAPGRTDGLSRSTYTILRLPDVLKARGRSRSSHYSDIKQGLYTRPVTLGANCVGWPEKEVIALNEARIAAWGEEEIRQLVRHLEAQRRGQT